MWFLILVASPPVMPQSLHIRRPSGPRPTQLLTNGESRKSGRKERRKRRISFSSFLFVCFYSEGGEELVVGAPFLSFSLSFEFVRCTIFEFAGYNLWHERLTSAFPDKKEVSKSLYKKFVNISNHWLQTHPVKTRHFYLEVWFGDGKNA